MPHMYTKIIKINVATIIKESQASNMSKVSAVEKF